MSPSIWQLLLVVVIVFIIFGAGKLPSVMHDLSKGIKNFRDGLKGEDAKKDDEATKELPEEKPEKDPEKKSKKDKK